MNYRLIECCILYECINDEVLVQRLRKYIHKQGKVVPRKRHGANRTEILKLIIERKLRNSIAFIDHDQPENWSSRQVHILYNKRPFKSIGHAYWYHDRETNVLIIIFDRNLEDWLLRICKTKSITWDELHRNVKKFQKLLSNNRDIIQVFFKEVTELLHKYHIIS